VLLEAPIQQLDLRREGVACGVAVEVGEVLVVLDRLEVHRQSEVPPQRLGERGLAGSDEAGNADEKVLQSQFVHDR